MTGNGATKLELELERNEKEEGLVGAIHVRVSGVLGIKSKSKIRLCASGDVIMWAETGEGVPRTGRARAVGTTEAESGLA